MASTIKLKNSTTAGNSPSSLETGEVAINVADGNLFYGSASAVLQNFVVDELEVKGNLTAQQYIVSSSVTHMTTSFSSGSTVFGDTQDDTHLFTGSINVTGSITSERSVDGGDNVIQVINSNTDTGTDKGAGIEFLHGSANISGESGINRVAGKILSTKAGTYNGTTDAIDSNLEFYTAKDNSNIKRLEIDEEGDSTFFGNLHITQSNPSTNEKLFTIGEDGTERFRVDAEGDVVAIGVGTFNKVQVTNDGNQSGPAIAFGTDTNTGIYQPADNKISLQADGGSTELTVDTSGIDIVGDLDISSHITASGDISASGTITAATLDAAAVSDTLAAAIVAEIDNDEIPVAKLAEDSISGVTLGGNLNNLTVDDATLQLNSGTTFNGSAARTISIKDGGVDSDALTANIAVTQLTSSIISASGDIFCTNITIAEDIVSVGDDIILKDNLAVSSSGGSIQFRGTAGGSNESITYLDSGGSGRFALLFPGSDVVAITNRASNGNVEIRANTSTAGASGEVTVANFEDDKITHNVKSEIRLAKTSNTDADYNGDVVFFGGTTSMTAGRIYHFKSDGTWELANPNAVATSDGLLAVALGAASDTNGMLLKGMVTLDHDPGAVGDVLYLDEQQVSSAYGAATSGAPAGTGDVVRIIGYCLDASNGQIYFDPSKDHIVHA